MANSIRTPRQGVTANSRRIAEAVDNEEWQQYRLMMKGKSTETKLQMLAGYYDQMPHTHIIAVLPGGTLSDTTDCDVCIRVDNYIKALCRGGQLYSGESLLTALPSFHLRIKRN